VDLSRGGAKVVKFYFTQSKLRKQPFFVEKLIGKLLQNSDARVCRP